MRLTFTLFFAAAILAPAQIVSFGVKAGIPLTPALPYFYDYGSNMLDTGRWTIGPTVELRLGRGFAFEVDALYRGYSAVNAYASPQVILPGINLVPTFSSNRQNTKVWDFPLLLKYRFTAGRVHPFVALGYTRSHESSDVNGSFTCLGTADACSASNLSPYYHNFTYKGSYNREGATAGVGVEFKYGKIKIAPEVRYTRFFQPNQSNATLMVGFTF